VSQRNLSAEQQLIDVGGFLIRQIFDVKVMTEAVRTLLVERGVFSEEQYQATYARLAEELRATTQKVVADAESSESVLQLLERQKGTVQ
jgi:hypothetical protein